MPLGLSAGTDGLILSEALPRPNFSPLFDAPQAWSSKNDAPRPDKFRIAARGSWVKAAKRPVGVALMQLSTLLA